jgi:hypothetical protein
MAVARSTVPPHRTRSNVAHATSAADAFTKQSYSLTHDARRASRVLLANAKTVRTGAQQYAAGTAVVMSSSLRLGADRFGKLRSTSVRHRPDSAPCKRSTRMAMATPGRQATSLTSSGSWSVVRHARSSGHQQ